MLTLSRSVIGSAGPPGGGSKQIDAEYSRLSAGGRHRRMVYRSARSGRRSALRRGSVVPTAAGWRGSLAITNAPAVSNL